MKKWFFLPLLCAALLCGCAREPSAQERSAQVFAMDTVMVLTAGGVAGAMRAVTESGRKVRVITYDAPDETVRYLQTGAISATICQDPHAQGYRACKALFDYLSDGISPTDFHTAIDIRIRENI